ncbi:sodium-dependent phosphate transporter 1 [Drosophila busckii]|uniref:sodium-dependent phosphate transporter 1 n=1 Tax=Drosophila busckii TaxID=30019 RepID=UPI00083F32A0|nr:sodium-dependent phosphate transporter 1 [Drosophila busckii]
MESYSPDLLWMVVIGFLIAFVLAFGIGANDVANSFGTSVGSGVLTIRQACILATICEISGAVLIGYKVSDTMRKGILEVSLYEGAEEVLMLGCVAALASSAVWLLVATFLKLPISGTHSIVGSTIGFSLVARGLQGLKWSTLGTIVGSWFISPVLSGVVSILLFLAIRRFILRAQEPLKAGFRSLPIFYGVTFFINVISVVMDGPKLLYMDNIPTWIAVSTSMGLSLLVALLTQLVVVPLQRRSIAKKLRAEQPVKFNFEDSVESSPSGSPKKQRRPLSLVSEGKPLPAIAEITELVSISDNSPRTFKLAPFGLAGKNNNANVEDYKINPELIRKAEDLLGKASLDNTDLTVTSLNYIDEQQLQQTGRKLQECFKRVQSPKEEHKPKEAAAAAGSGTNNNLQVVESAASLELMLNNTLSPNSSKVPLIESKEALHEQDEEYKRQAEHRTSSGEETQEISMLFSFLQILTATFGSFAHGGNDVSNAIGPLIALYMIYREGSVMQQAESPIYILIYGGIGISVGLWLWGRRVIETIGNDLTKITSSTGFTIEVGAAITVLLASKIGLPISTTHCKVGSVVFVGHVSAAGRKQKRQQAQPEEQEQTAAAVMEDGSVDWHLFRNIAYAWIVTVPVTALLSAGMMYVLCAIVVDDMSGQGADQLVQLQHNYSIINNNTS